MVTICLQRFASHCFRTLWRTPSWMRRCRKYDSWPLVGQMPAPNESNCLQGGRNFLRRADSWRAMMEAFGEGRVVRAAGTYPDGELCDWWEVTCLAPGQVHRCQADFSAIPSILPALVHLQLSLIHLFQRERQWSEFQLVSLSRV